MGILDFIFGSGKKKKKGILFSTLREVERTLFYLGTLNQEQQVLVQGMIAKFMGTGGVSVEEFRTRVLPELYKLVREGKISSVDYQKLKNLIYE